MKRVVMSDGAGPYVVGAEGEKLRPDGRTRFSPGAKVAVAILGCAHAGAVRAALWNPDRPRELTQEVWDSGKRGVDGYSPDEYVLCTSVRKIGYTCRQVNAEEPEGWCDSCLRHLPLDVAKPNKPWRGTTPEERTLLIATIARREQLNLRPVGERWLVAREVSALFPEVDGKGEREIQQWVVDGIRPVTERVHAPSLDQAAHYAATRFGVDEQLILSARPTANHGEFLVKFVRPK